MKAFGVRPTGTGLVSTVLMLCLTAVIALAACGGEQAAPAVATTTPATPTAAATPAATVSVAAEPQPTATVAPADTPVPVATPTPTPKPAAVATPGATSQPTETPTTTPAATATATPQPTPVPTSTSTPEPTAAATPTATPAPTATRAPPPTPAATPTPTISPIATPSPAPTPSVHPPPDELALDPFYRKYIDAQGLPVVSSSKVPDKVLYRARDIINEMLANRSDLRATIAGLGVRVAVMAQSEVTTDIPEHGDLYEAFAGTDWDRRARGLGATLARPATSAAEENLLCYENDVYRSEDIFVHEFAHTVLDLGVKHQERSAEFLVRLNAAYRGAMESGLWADTYAARNVDEYWAEAVQSWFGVNDWAIPANGIHNQINTRQELEAYDPRIANWSARSLETSPSRLRVTQ